MVSCLLRLLHSKAIELALSQLGNSVIFPTQSLGLMFAQYIGVLKKRERATIGRIILTYEIWAVPQASCSIYITVPGLVIYVKELKVLPTQ